jgi:hypothetical protein
MFQIMQVVSAPLIAMTAFISWARYAGEIGFFGSSPFA